MRSSVLFLFTAVVTYVTAQNIPSGFIPLPPLPVQLFPGKPTNKPKVTPKPTQAPITKKPVVTKGTPKPTQAPITKKPITTKAPFRFTTTVPTLQPSSQKPVAQNTNCGLNINVPKANCQGGNSAVQQSLDTLKKELDRTRQQQQSQNAAVQSLITKLQTQQSSYINKISDLQNEVRNLVLAFNSKQPISTAAPAAVTSAPQIPGVSSSLLQQAVQNVRTDMNSAVRDFNNKVFNLSSLMIADQQQEMKIHQSIESEIRQQASDIGRLSQQVRDLNLLLQQLNTTSNGGTGATNADVAKLQAKISKVENDIQQYDQKQQSKVNSLTSKTASLESQVRNHTNEINGLQTRLLIEQSKVSKVDKDITVVHDALAQFRKTTLPKMNQIDSDVQKLTTNLTTIDASVKRVAKTAFNLVMQVGQDSAKLTSLDTQSNQLKTDVKKIETDLTSQKNEIRNIQSGMTSLKNAIPLAELTQMNNSVLDVLNAVSTGKTPTKKQLQDLTQAITAIKNKLGSISTGPSSG